MKISLIAFFIVLLLGCSTFPNSEKIDTKYGSFTYYLSGTAKPTVVFEAGLGDDMTTWSAVIGPIEQFAEVFAYNRAGFRGSKSKTKTRNGKVIVEELRDLLRTNQLEPPYILVGHSLGGAYMELYARTHPNEVAGVVLVDTNSSKYPDRCKQEKLEHCDPPTSIPKWASVFLPYAVEGEIKGFSDTHMQINTANEFPNVPLFVINAMQQEFGQTPEQKRARELYVQLHQELSNASTISKFVSCNKCGHYIQKEQPNLVIDAVRWVVAQ